MQRYPRLAVAATILMTITAACSSAAPATPTPTVAPPAATPTTVATSVPTTVPTVAPTTATPGPTEIPYPGPSIPAGTLTLKISAQNIAFDKTDLAAAANTPFVIAFDNKDAGVSHNVAIRLDSNGPLIFNPLPAIVGPSHADYFISGGLAAGAYRFLCIVHPNMTGTLTIGP